MERINLKLWTSYITPESFNEFILKNILPIFIARNISNSGLIGSWQDTSVHFPELAPRPDLLRFWKYQGMSTEEFDKLFTEDLKKVDIFKILEKINMMCGICNSKGAVLLGYGEDPMKDHRHTVMNYINSLGILFSNITEL